LGATQPPLQGVPGVHSRRQSGRSLKLTSHLYRSPATHIRVHGMVRGSSEWIAATFQSALEQSIAAGHNFWTNVKFRILAVAVWGTVPRIAAKGHRVTTCTLRAYTFQSREGQMCTVSRAWSGLSWRRMWASGGALWTP
jgi:hypothetical protein